MCFSALIFVVCSARFNPVYHFLLGTFPLWPQIIGFSWFSSKNALGSLPFLRLNLDSLPEPGKASPPRTPLRPSAAPFPTGLSFWVTSSEGLPLTGPSSNGPCLVPSPTEALLCIRH